MKMEIWEKIIDKAYGYVLQYGMDVLAAVLIFIVGRWSAKFLSNLFSNILIKVKVNKTLASFIRHLLYYGILTFVVIAALNKLGIETSFFIAVVGAASFAIGLALQGALANFAAGVMLILFRPFQVGDVIDAGGVKGTVEEIQIFNTVVIMADKIRAIIPNARITADKILVFSEGAQA